MTQYRSDSPDEIRTVFALEGESLGREGFVEPDLTDEPEGYARLATVSLGEMAVATGGDAPDPVAEAALRQIDLEAYHQG